MKIRTPFIATLLTASLILGGCASTADYQAYSHGQAAIEQAKYAAEAARFRAMSDIAATGDPSAKVAAVVALAMSSGGGHGGQQAAQLRAPEAPGQTALQWASVLVPAITQGYSIYSNTKLGMAQSNNTARVAESTNQTFLGMSGNVRDTSVASSTALTNLSAASGQALLQLGQSSNTALTTLGQSNGAALSTLANVLPNLQPNVTYTLSGNGVIGNGTYTGPVTTTTRTNTINGSGTTGNGNYTSAVVNNPVPVVITPVVTTPATVITPVVITNP